MGCGSSISRQTLTSLQYQEYLSQSQQQIGFDHQRLLAQQQQMGVGQQRQQKPMTYVRYKLEEIRKEKLKKVAERLERKARRQRIALVILAIIILEAICLSMVS